jgi:hypothetical protein
LDAAASLISLLFFKLNFFRISLSPQARAFRQISQISNPFFFPFHNSVLYEALRIFVSWSPFKIVLRFIVTSRISGCQLNLPLPGTPETCTQDLYRCIRGSEDSKIRPIAARAFPGRAVSQVVTLYSILSSHFTSVGSGSRCTGSLWYRSSPFVRQTRRAV